MPPHPVPVHPHHAIPKHPIELDRQPPSEVRRRDLERPPIPPHARLRMVRPDRVKPMVAQFLVAPRVQRQFDGPIVWDIHDPPLRIIERRRRRPPRLPSLHQATAPAEIEVQRIVRRVPQREPPTPIHQQPFPHIRRLHTIPAPPRANLRDFEITENGCRFSFHANTPRRLRYNGRAAERFSPTR